MYLNRPLHSLYTEVVHVHFHWLEQKVSRRLRVEQSTRTSRCHFRAQSNNDNALVLVIRTAHYLQRMSNLKSLLLLLLLFLSQLETLRRNIGTLMQSRANCNGIKGLNRKVIVTRRSAHHFLNTNLPFTCIVIISTNIDNPST